MMPLAIAIGVGCRSGCAGAVVAALVRRARAACDDAGVARLFTVADKQHEPGLLEAEVPARVTFGSAGAKAVAAGLRPNRDRGDWASALEARRLAATAAAAIGVLMGDPPSLGSRD